MQLYPSKTQKLADNLYMVGSVAANFYIYNTGKSLIAFDAGMGPRSAANGMKTLGLPPEKVSHVFLTHSDRDHVGGLPLFKNASVYFSKREVPMVQGEVPRFFSFIYNRRIKNATPLEDGRTIRADGDYVQIISAPGHTPGSACYLINKKIFVTGDLMKITSKGEIKPFTPFICMDGGENAQTLEKVKKEGLFEKSDWILTGHTGAMKNVQ